MDFKTLREANLKRVVVFRDKQGRICHPNGVASWSVNDWFAAMIGECGEFSNLYKKVCRGDFPLEDARDELADELADIQTYLDLLAARLNIDLGKATMDKWNRVSERVNSNLRIGDDAVFIKTKGDENGI